MPDFVYLSYKKDLDENESIKVKFIKICNCFRSAQLSAPFGVSFGVNGVRYYILYRNERNIVVCDSFQIQIKLSTH